MHGPAQPGQQLRAPLGDGWFHGPADPGYIRAKSGRFVYVLAAGSLEAVTE